MRKLATALCLLWLTLAHSAYAADGDGERLTLKTDDGKSFAAYRVGPRGARIGILLVHGAWGLSDNIVAWADWLGRNGYRVVAVDLYDGKHAQSRDEANRLSAVVDQGSANAEYRAAVAILKAPGRDLVTMGWEFGGTQALQASLALPTAIAASVVYDGALLTDAKQVEQLRTPVLAMFARDPDDAKREQIRTFETQMKRVKRPLVVKYYPPEIVDDTPAERVYDAKAADAVWSDTEAFFKKYVLTIKRPSATRKRRPSRKKRH